MRVNGYMYVGTKLEQKSWAGNKKILMKEMN